MTNITYNEKAYSDPKVNSMIKMLIGYAKPGYKHTSLFERFNVGEANVIAYISPQKTVDSTNDMSKYDQQALELNKDEYQELNSQLNKLKTQSKDNPTDEQLQARIKMGERTVGKILQKIDRLSSYDVKFIQVIAKQDDKQYHFYLASQGEFGQEVEPRRMIQHLEGLEHVFDIMADMSGDFHLDNLAGGFICLRPTAKKLHLYGSSESLGDFTPDAYADIEQYMKRRLPDYSLERNREF